MKLTRKHEGSALYPTKYQQAWEKEFAFVCPSKTSNYISFSLQGMQQGCFSNPSGNIRYSEACVPLIRCGPLNSNSLSGNFRLFQGNWYFPTNNFDNKKTLLFKDIFTPFSCKLSGTTLRQLRCGTGPFKEIESVIDPCVLLCAV